jgi:hypothetical protein
VIGTAAARSFSKEPGIAARVIAGAAAHGFRLPVDGEEAEEQAAKAVQAVIDVAPVTAQAFMAATISQHGASPAQMLNNMQIEQAIKTKPPS